MHKTGSSSIQEALQGYDDGTTSYCGFGQKNHSVPLSILFTENPMKSGPVKRRGKNKTWVAQRKALLTEILMREVNDKKTNTVMSGEGLSTNFSAREIKRMLAFLEPHYSEIRITAYIRPVRSFTVSAFQQRVKSGGMTSGNSGLVVPAPNYRKRFGPWVKVAGAERITFSKFDRTLLLNNDIVEDFFNWAGLDTARIEKKAMNETISAEAISLLYCHNKFRGTPTHNQQETNEQKYLIAKFRSIGNSRFSFSDKLMDQLLAQQAEQIDWMEKNTGFGLRDAAKPGDIIIDSEQDIIDLAAQQSEALKAVFSDQQDDLPSFVTANNTLMQALGAPRP